MFDTEEKCIHSTATYLKTIFSLVLCFQTLKFIQKQCNTYHEQPKNYVTEGVL
jgi:hypothetical protein